ncbi:MAG: DUF2470 domain-containing protein [Microthrixaceae bacterium]
MSAVSSWLSSDVIEAITSHMNSEHVDDSLIIVRSHGGVPDATGALVAHLDERSITFSVDRPDGPAGTVVVPWPAPVAERADIRRELVALVESAGGR